LAAGDRGGAVRVRRAARLIEGGASTFAGQVPTILKVNGANSLARQKEAADQASYRQRQGPLRLGCSAIGFTIYPGSDAAYSQMNDITEMAREAKAHGLAVVIWSYPRGGNLTREGETGDRHHRLCGAARRPARRPHHQGQAADRASRTRRREAGL